MEPLPLFVLLVFVLLLAALCLHARPEPGSTPGPEDDEKNIAYWRGRHYQQGLDSAELVESLQEQVDWLRENALTKSNASPPQITANEMAPTSSSSQEPKA